MSDFSKGMTMNALRVFILLLCVLLPGSPSQADDIWQWLPRHTEDKAFEYILDGASIDIMADIELWVQLRTEVDAAYGEGWQYALARKIPSQALGVIEVAARTDYPPDLLCTVPFIEEDDDIVDEWARRSIATLESFTMVDAKKERIRRQCLERIQADVTMYHKK
jgi:hypothetical protein